MISYITMEDSVRVFSSRARYSTLTCPLGLLSLEKRGRGTGSRDGNIFSCVVCKDVWFSRRP